MNNKFGERIKELRKERGLSQEDLARKLGIDRTTVTHWESKGTEPNFDMLIEIAALFDVSTDYLLGIEN